MNVSVIVVTYNSRENIVRCLRHLANGNLSADDEVINVDNGSHDGTVEAAAGELPRLRILPQGVNMGFAAAVNAGARIAGGDLLLFLNPDADLPPGTLPEAVRFLEQHPEFSVLGCRFVNTNGTPQHSARSFPTLGSLFGESLFLNNIIPHGMPFGDPWVWETVTPVPVDVVKGAFFLVRRTAWEEVGPFDEQFFLYSEEQDWCKRANARGHRVVLYPGLEVPHAEGVGVEISSRSTRLLVFDSEYKYFRKHHGPAYAIGARCFMIFGAAIRLLLWAGIALFGGGSGARNRMRYYAFGLGRMFRPPASPSLLRSQPLK